MEQILIVEDEKRIRDIVRDYFTAHGLGCDLARDGAEALDLLRDHDYDAILLDVFMPNLDGFQVCRAVRQRSQVPILFLTALGNEEDMLRGYALGCDDYVTKPFSLAVLLAKTRALIRRGRGGSGTLACGAVSLDPGGRTCAVEGREIKLSPREFDLLELLMRHHDRCVPLAQLVGTVWGHDCTTDPSVVWTNVSYLRRRIATVGSSARIVARRSQGYTLVTRP